MRPNARKSIVTVGILSVLAATAAALALPHGATPAELEKTPARHAHLRLWDADGTLLLTTWPGENGTFQSKGFEHAPEGPVHWTPTTIPALRAIAPMLESAPEGVRVRAEGVRVPPLALERVTFDRTLDLPVEGTFAGDEAARVFGDLTAGTRAYFLGRLPMEILDAGPDVVRYRFLVNETTTIDVPRGEGLFVEAAPTADGAIRFTLHAPDGEFTAKKNCRLPEQPLAAGHYVVEDESGETWTLAKYRNRAEHEVEGRTVTIEALFVHAGLGHAHKQATEGTEGERTNGKGTQSL